MNMKNFSSICFAEPVWLDWGAWSQCSLSCGRGEKRRLRECSTGILLDCGVNSLDVSVCSTQDCPDSNYQFVFVK